MNYNKAEKNSAHGLIWGTNLEFVWKDWAKPQKTVNRLNHGLRFQSENSQIQRRSATHMTAMLHKCEENTAHSDADNSTTDFY
jgi:hypothetical protein